MTERKTVRVRDIMKSPVTTIEGIATVSEALRKMHDEKTAFLVVNKRHDNDEYGMLLVTDIARKVLARGRSPERVNVYEIMTKPVIAVRPDMEIHHCAQLFAQYDLVRAPVVENGEVIGGVSPFAMVVEGMYSQL